MTSGMVARAVLNLLAPVSCAGCRKPDVSVCQRCLQALAGPVKIATPVVSRALFGVPVISGGLYLGVRRSIVVEMKESGRWRLASALATTELASYITDVIARNPGIVVVPLPPSRRGRWKRGYAPTWLFAKALVQSIANARLSMAVRPQLRNELWRFSPHTRIPVRTREQRLGRQSLGFQVSGLPQCAPVILVDDVMATGATLEAVAAALAKRGHQVVLVVVAAHVPERHQVPIPSIAKPGYSEGTTLTRRT